MILLVGLGNPGPRYAGHRHNFGFMAADAIWRRHHFPPFRKRFHSEIAEGSLGDVRTILQKPATYMNESGQAVGEAMRYLKLTPSQVIVMHDELDLAEGKVRVKLGGGAAGHNGVRSVVQHIGPDFWRVRLGIGHPGDKDLVLAYALSDFFAEERPWRDAVLEAVADAAPLLAAGDTGRFMNRVSVLTRPPAPKPETPAPSTPPRDA